jgi:hypothetical protein
MLSVSTLVAGLSLAALSVAHAQSLRGQITEEQAADDLLLKRKPGAAATDKAAQAASGSAIDSKTGGQAGNRTATEEYQPISSGGLTAAEEADQRDPDATIADETTPPPAPNDPFADSDMAPSSRPAKSGKKTKSGANTASAAAARRTQTAAQRGGAQGQDELTTGTARTATIDSGDRNELKLDEGAEREKAIESPGRRQEDNPYAALGIRAGSFILRPSVEQGFTYTTNANSSPNGSEAIQSDTTLRLNAVSDWSQHYAAIEAYGIFRKSLSGEDLQQIEGGIAQTIDYDLSRELKLKTAVGYAFKPESASSPVILGNVVEQPLRHTFNASLGLTKETGKFEYGVTVASERNMYGEAELDTGGTLNQDDRNAALTTISLRGGYEISPAITPFVEVELGRRQYDLTADAAGYERSADRVAARAGVKLDMREKLVGELSAGWLRESFDDARLDPISGLDLIADLRWSPERETTIGLRASTTVEGTTTAGESGSLLHAGRLSIERQIRTNLSANATLGVDWRTYNSTGDHDLVLSAEAGATWWLNRYLGITGRLKHEQLTSDLPGRDYKADSVFLGVKVQR